MITTVIVVNQVAASVINMKAGIKEKWIANLRSGNYKKTTGKLKTTPTTANKECAYCAMGVLIDMYINSNDNCRWNGGSLVVNGKTMGNAVLPAIVQEWAGINTAHGTYVGGGAIITDNDHMGLSFAQIADKLETTDLV